MNENERIKSERDGLDVLEDIRRYGKTGFDSIHPDDFLRMRWWGFYQQKPNVGHFMLRIKIPGGQVTAEQLREVAAVSHEFGQDLVDITTRQCFQFHWLTIENMAEIIDRFNRVGIYTQGACGDIFRNPTGCPVAGIDPDEVFDATPILEEIHQHFLHNKEFSNLPRKYKTSIAGCCVHCAQPEINCVGATGVKRTLADGTEEVGFEVRIGGGLSARPFFAKKLNMFVPPDKLLSVFRAVTELFRDNGNRDNRKKARLKFIVDEWGIEKFEQEVRAKLDWTPDPGVDWPEPRKSFRDHMGVHRQKQEGLNWIGVPVLTGRMNAQQLATVADVAAKYGDGSIRTTNQQNFLIPGVADANVAAAVAELEAAGFKINASPLRRVAVACTGSQFCNLALTETKQLMVDIVEHLDANVVLEEQIRINLNGCPNSCGQHHIGDIGLQGCVVKVPGGESVEGYDISLGGRLGADQKFVRPIWRRVPATDVKVALANLLNGYLETKEEDDDFSSFVDRTADADLAALMKTTFAELA